ncbi:glycerol-3-phosphate O-acyltransferase [Schizosaccharomyces japonicus yFS275]|uniref:Glycerol-3-phosphate O-acyltransferase n=1 Tax=Schizosaccharomyces japonicus (strain yFS275 / FY16936) TaxID=402676 RepID=B6K0T9_SCHJY|nr:glycerol-3-phosphate O-acyltransferase [Schizosaccharomyces japonicus yFS275]EEB07560.1 glycerol-3-phosphate O-acyltransferase [Schizosaccharomyces japonicus yFS275]
MEYPFIYDTLLWVFSVLIDFFFREVRTRGTFRVPRKGPLILVAAPHANQFVDPVIFMRQLRRETGRRISFLIAAKSMRMKFIGTMAKAFGAIPVERAQDLAKKGAGTIRIGDDPCSIVGNGTEFTNYKIGYTIILPNNAGTSEIMSIEDDTHVRIKRPFRSSASEKLRSGESNFKIAPKIDQRQVFESVYHRLLHGSCVGLFPEGGSHDRPEMLPLKAGVAIMALGTLAKDPNCGLTIVPCGMNYFHPHRFRSRAVLEFGAPFSIPSELVEMYKSGERREAIQRVLDLVYDALLSVTVQAPDFETLMVIQACRRLYRPDHVYMSLPRVVDLNRKLIIGYNRCKDDPRVQHLRDRILLYNRQLYRLGIRDHQVSKFKYNRFRILYQLIYRCCWLTIMALGALPGCILFSPVFIAASRISHKKAQQALKSSTVKIQGRDVLATWKLLVALGFAPVLYTFYAALCEWIIYHYNLVPHSSWLMYATPFFSAILFPMVTYAALRFGEVGVDTYKSIRPLFLALNPRTANAVYVIQREREELVKQCTEVFNSLAPDLFPEMDVPRLITPGTTGSAEDSDSELPSRFHRRLSSSVASDVDNLSQLHDLDSPPSSDAVENNNSTVKPGNVYLFSPSPAVREPGAQMTEDEARLIRTAHRERMGLRFRQLGARDLMNNEVFSESDDDLSS